MRKLLTFALAGSLLISGLMAPANAGKKKKKAPKPRTVEATYDAPAIGALGVGICSPGTIGCVDFPSIPGERYVKVEVKDSVGPMVYASITQDLNGDNQADTGTDICTSTEEAVPIEEGYGVTIFIWEGPGPSPVCAGAATSGTIKVTFSATP